MTILLLCVSRDTGRIDFPQVDGWSTDTPVLGHHTISYTSRAKCLVLPSVSRKT